jgi:hypothetical protein
VIREALDHVPDRAKLNEDYASKYRVGSRVINKSQLEGTVVEHKYMSGAPVDGKDWRALILVVKMDSGRMTAFMPTSSSWKLSE